MKYLVINTCSSPGSVFLFSLNAEGVPLVGAIRKWTQPQSQSEMITIFVSEILKQSGTDLSEIEAIIVHQGPGSFTGIRVGLCLAKTLAYSLQKPILTFSQFDYWLAKSHEIQDFQSDKSPLLIVLPALRDIFYVGFYDCQKNVWQSEFESLTVSELVEKCMSLQRFRLAGDGATKFLDLCPASVKKSAILLDQNPPQESSLIRTLDLNLKKLDKFSWKNVNPLYIRGSEAEEKLRRGLLRPVKIRHQ